MNRARGGFSLFEVLIAFAILSLVLVTLIPGQARLIGRATDAEQQALAYDYALSVAAELNVTSPLAIGSVERTYRNWSVRQDTVPIALTERGQIVETIILIGLVDGRELTSLTKFGFIPNAS